VGGLTEFEGTQGLFGFQLHDMPHGDALHKPNDGMPPLEPEDDFVVVDSGTACTLLPAHLRSFLYDVRGVDPKQYVLPDGQSCVLDRQACLTASVRDQGMKEPALLDFPFFLIFFNSN